MRTMTAVDALAIHDHSQVNQSHVPPRTRRRIALRKVTPNVYPH